MKKEKTPEQALADMMRLCARAERSSGDALRLMRRWGISEADAACLLRRLVDEGFIDDRRYAGMYVRDKTKLSGWGPYKIAAGLKAKGVAREVAAEALAGVGEQVGGDRLYELLNRKAGSYKSADPYELKGKLMRFGLSRGFDYSAVLEAVEKIVKNDD